MMCALPRTLIIIFGWDCLYLCFLWGGPRWEGGRISDYSMGFFVVFEDKYAHQ